MAYRQTNSILVSRTPVLLIPGVESLYLTVRLVDRFELVLVCHSHHDPSLSPPGLTNFISIVVLKSSSLLIFMLSDVAWHS